MNSVIYCRHLDSASLLTSGFCTTYYWLLNSALSTTDFWTLHYLLLISELCIIYYWFLNLSSLTPDLWTLHLLLLISMSLLTLKLCVIYYWTFALLLNPHTMHSFKPCPIFSENNKQHLTHFLFHCQEGPTYDLAHRLCFQKTTLLLYMYVAGMFPGLGHACVWLDTVQVWQQIWANEFQLHTELCLQWTTVWLRGRLFFTGTWLPPHLQSGTAGQCPWDTASAVHADLRVLWPAAALRGAHCAPTHCITWENVICFSVFAAAMIVTHSCNKVPSSSCDGRWSGAGLLGEGSLFPVGGGPLLGTAKANHRPSPAQHGVKYDSLGCNEGISLRLRKWHQVVFVELLN